MSTSNYYLTNMIYQDKKSPTSTNRNVATVIPELCSFAVLARFDESGASGKRRGPMLEDALIDIGQLDR